MLHVYWYKGNFELPLVAKVLFYFSKSAWNSKMADIEQHSFKRDWFLPRCMLAFCVNYGKILSSLMRTIHLPKKHWSDCMKKKMKGDFLLMFKV